MVTTVSLPDTTADALPNTLHHSLRRASELIRERRTELRESPMPTSHADLDNLLGGGLPQGAMVEIMGRGSCGRFAALLAALQAVTGSGEAAALVDQGEQLDPQTAAEVGIDLEYLLWIRPQNLRDSLAAAELLVHTGFPLVALDLGLPPVRGRVPLAAWIRLARNATSHGARVLVGSPYRLSGCAASIVIAGDRGRGVWSADHRAPSLLNGLRARLHVVRRVRHPNHNQVSTAFTLAEAAFGPVVPADPPTGIRNADAPLTHTRKAASSEIEAERKNNHAATL